MVYDIMSDAQRRTLKKPMSAIFPSRWVTSHVSVSTFFMQRKGEGAVFRTIPTKIHDPRRTGHAADSPTALR